MSGSAIQPAAKSAPLSVGLSAAARLLGTAVKLAAALRSAGVTTAITYAVRVGTSICDKALRTSSKASAIGRLGANAASTRHTLAGRWVKTMVLSKPMRRATIGAARREPALSNPAQKKNAPACASDSPNRCSSQSDSSALMTRPPANASTLNSAAYRKTTPRDGPSGAARTGSLSGLLEASWR